MSSLSAPQSGVRGRGRWAHCVIALPDTPIEHGARHEHRQTMTHRIPSLCVSALVTHNAKHSGERNGWFARIIRIPRSHTSRSEMGVVWCGMVKVSIHLNWLTDCRPSPQARPRLKQCSSSPPSRVPRLSVHNNQLPISQSPTIPSRHEFYTANHQKAQGKKKNTTRKTPQA